MPDWLIWAIVAVALAVGEIFTPGLFFLGPVAVAAVAAGVAAALGGGAVLQLILFIAGSLASLAFLRPLARAHLHLPAVLRTGTAALVGTRATVLQEGEVFEEGAQVEVAEIKGATALIYK
ncbi:MAG: NfeD family protein [Actinobacteria bacterium]|nr:MAG: NfeD family protein [Actinomycetota bacterium]